MSRMMMLGVCVMVVMGVSVPEKVEAQTRRWVGIGVAFAGAVLAAADINGPSTCPSIHPGHESLPPSEWSDWEAAPLVDQWASPWEVRNQSYWHATLPQTRSMPHNGTCLRAFTIFQEHPWQQRLTGRPEDVKPYGSSRGSYFRSNDPNLTQEQQRIRDRILELYGNVDPVHSSNRLQLYGGFALIGLGAMMAIIPDSPVQPIVNLRSRTFGVQRSLSW